jgi:two-component system phosphate regulon response regulator OmpR
MPEQNGLSLTRELRETIDTPILLLTARNEVEDRISGLEAGADDYLPKPFEPKELLLRIHAILRRMPDVAPPQDTPKMLSLGATRYDVQKGELWEGDTQIRLTSTELELMRIFSKNIGQALSRMELVTQMGREDGNSQDRAIDVQITRLRKKIETNPKEPRYLQTVRGSGYMLACD